MSRLFCTFVVEKKTSSNTKPQDPEGHTIMNQEKIDDLVNTVKTIEKEAKLSILDELNDKLLNKIRGYNNILNSSEALNIYLNAYGYKWEILRDLRYRLQAKERLIEEISGMVYEIRYNERKNII